MMGRNITSEELVDSLYRGASLLAEWAQRVMDDVQSGDYAAEQAGSDREELLNDLVAPLSHDLVLWKAINRAR